MSFFRSQPEADGAASESAQSGDASTRPSWIARDLRIKGELVAEGNIFVQGSVVGTIECNGQVVVQAAGRLQADVTAKRIDVHGTVVGDLKATDAAVLGAEARVNGNIDAPSLTVTPGATFHGQTRTGAKPQEDGAGSESEAPAGAKPS